MLRRMVAIPFLLMFVLGNAYAGITWVEDTIIATDLPVNSFMFLYGANGAQARTWKAQLNNSDTFSLRCEQSAEKAMASMGNYYYAPHDGVYIGLIGIYSPPGAWVTASYAYLELRKPQGSNTFKIYCLLADSGNSYNAMSDESKNADNIGVIYNITVSSIALPVLSTTGSLELGDVRRDETVTRPVPLSMSYAGGTDNSKTLSGNVSWIITPAADNPSPLKPVIKKGGVPVESFTVSLTNDQIQNDDFTVSLTGNEYPGAYSWTMNVTTTIE